MRTFFPGAALLAAVVLAACSSSQPPQAGSAKPSSRATAAPAPVEASAAEQLAELSRLAERDSRPNDGTTPRSVATGAAPLPDRGELLTYRKDAGVRHRGAFTEYPVSLSEAHALNAAKAGGVMTINAPNGELIHLSYDSVIEHTGGDWSWVGHDSNGTPALLTFGKTAVFASIPQGLKDTLRVTTYAGHTLLVQTDRSKLGNLADVFGHDSDQLIPPQAAAEVVRKRSEATQVVTAGSAQAAATPATTLVDVALGYTDGFIANYSSEAEALSRLSYLVDYTNVAYQSSGINARIRVVKALKVSYADTSDNGSTLEKLTGYKQAGGTTAVDPAFNDLRAARETFGADLVSLVRSFRTESGNCGIAWLIGANGQQISTANAPFGYSVVSDGSYRGANDTTYTCYPGSLAHELGHNMGQQHNVEDSAGQAGAHPYSYGYRETLESGFNTLMAYPLDSAQTAIQFFANPAVKYGNRPTGVADKSDNARSMNQTMPIVAGFRATVVPVTSVAPNLLGILKQGTTATEAHVLTSDSGFQTYSLHASTGLGKTGRDSRWVFELGDYNADGVLDLYCILKVGGSNHTEVHILNGKDNFKTYLLHTATALSNTGSDSAWVFKLGDYNKDGKLDLYAISKRGSSGKTEVHVLNGANKFSTYLAHVATVLPATGSNDAWKFELGDYDRDGTLDLYVIAKGFTGSGKTELYVISGASNFQNYLTQVVTPLPSLGQDNAWEFKIGDYNGDGALDLYGISKVAASGKTEVHVLDGVSRFQTYTLHKASALGNSGSDHTWEFLLTNP